MSDQKTVTSIAQKLLYVFLLHTLFCFLVKIVPFLENHSDPLMGIDPLRFMEKLIILYKEIGVKDKVKQKKRMGVFLLVMQSK